MMCEFAKNGIHLLILNTNYAICFRHALYCIIVRHLTISLIILLLRGAYMCNLFQMFTPQPSGLEGYCHHGPGGRPDGRLPDLRNLYLCNRLMDYLHSKFCGIVWACHCHLPICPLWPCHGPTICQICHKLGPDIAEHMSLKPLDGFTHLKFHGLV